jgi:hypothetical protein
MSYFYTTMAVIVVLGLGGAVVGYTSMFVPIPATHLRRLETGAYILLVGAVALSIVAINSNPY